MENWQLIVWGVHAVLAIFSIIDLFRNPRFQGAIRIMFLIPIIVVPIIGPLIYLLVRDAEPKDTPVKK